jgi:dihydroorotase
MSAQATELFTSVHVINPTLALDQFGDVEIQSGGNVSIQTKSAGEYSSQYLVPALVDLYARLREPGAAQKATVQSEALAAAASGVSIVCCAPETEPCIDSTAVVELIRDRARSAFDAGGARVFPIGAISKGLQHEQLSEFANLRQAGCVAFSMGSAAIVNSGFLRRAMQYARSFDVLLMLHPIDKFLSEDGVAHEGRVSARLGLVGIPESAETLALARDLMLIEETGVRAHISRISCARSVEMIAAAKKRGARITCDVAIANLFLCDNDVMGFDANMHLLPPLRTAADRDALRAGLKTGAIDAICSDHAPHDRDAKLAPFPMTEPGASTIEALLPLSLKLVQEGIIDMRRWVALVSTNPARILGIRQTDWLHVDVDQRISHDAKAGLRSQGANNPFANWELFGVAKRVIFG